MKKLKAYNVYVDNGEVTFKICVPAESKVDAEDFAKPCGEVVAVKDAETTVDACRLSNVLTKNGYNRQEIDLLVRLIERTGVGR